VSVGRAIVPSVSGERAFLEMLADFESLDPGHAEFYAPAKADFAAYVQCLLDEERGKNLREGWVPCTHRWLIDPAGAIVGVARLRHNINTPFLAESGGHIGYDVAPSQRRKGYGHLALSTALSEARRIGLTRVLLCAGQDNAASRAIIERQGGELESIAYSEFWGEQLCRYWVRVPR
jgi:predicted acetyltransferase